PPRDLRLAEPAAAHRNEAVELVDEDDRRGDLTRAVEEPRDLLFAFAIPFAEKVGRFGRDEIGFAFARGRLGKERLAGAGRTVEEEALGRANAETTERLRMLQGKLDAVAKAPACFPA